MGVNLGDTIKEEILMLQIKAPCCKSSFITGTELFVKNRRNKFTDRIAEYKQRLTQNKKRKSFFDDTDQLGYRIGEQDGQKLPVGDKVCPYCHSMLVRGAFLVCGRASITEKGKVGIHVEMALPNEITAEKLTRTLEEVGIRPKRAQRRGEILLYYKKRDVIEDFFAYVGAVTQSFEMINRGIMNSTMAVVKRQTICDETNIQRSITAAKKQLAAINAIRKKGCFDELPAALAQTALLRLENPSDSLEALTERHGGLSRSAVNRRLHKIIEWAEKKGYVIK